ncbi:DUF4350 domain-containing protein [Neobacillus ginsengisoli]|uniref:DUF4350 domain-containing protein n=1 Tax=Neobacillus ginsengisoli TaxID=904295 RepID=A0ABT9Y0R9_9BACI|nr:DUF4350 domain-containing protein [Neobacillus ginsengisoli]MDQ0201423.1 hypothetical protein [Neobacillus ginsengisoli]
MKKPQSNRLTWIWLTVLLLLFVLINYYIFSQKPKDYPIFVSDSPSPTGVKAIYTYLTKEMEGKRWADSPGLLPKNTDKQLLVMVEPSLIPDQKELEDYKSFMKAGNTILIFKSNPKGMFDLKTKPVKDDASPNRTMKVYDQNHAVYKAEISSAIRLSTQTKNEILLYDDAGPIALKQSFGKGQLIVSIAPEWMTNGKLLTDDHLPLILKLFKDSHTKTVLFDEYIHSGRNASTIFTVYPRWFLLLVLQGILLMILWLWHKGKRFGPVFVPREESVRFSDEGIQALTAWYLRGSRYHDSLLIQAEYVKLLLQEKWGIPYNRDWQELSGMFERKWLQLPVSEIRPLLNGLTNVMKKEKLSKQEYLLWSRKLERLRKEVEQG